MRVRAALVIVAAAILAADAAATESTIYPGVRIGKVRLGMTLAQVKHVAAQRHRGQHGDQACHTSPAEPVVGAHAEPGARAAAAG